MATPKQHFTAGATLRSPLKALLFDVDGTLAETEHAHLMAFNRAFAEAGLSWQWSVPLYTELLEVAGSAERIRHYIEYHLAEPDDAKNAAIRLTERLQKAKNRHYSAMVKRGDVALRQGVARLLEEARLGDKRLAIATTASLENVHTLLDKTLGRQAREWFEVIAAGNVVPRKKPAPDIYQFLLEQLNLKPWECIVFEDTENGLSAARHAGIEVVVITISEFSAGHDFGGASIVLDSLGEPDRPFRVIRGDPLGFSWVSLAFLEQLYASKVGLLSGPAQGIS
jgi:HAD superfamily hydrolase (TIGR01509 family)